MIPYDKHNVNEFDCINHNKYEEREKTDPVYNIVKSRSEAMERGKK